MLAFLNRWFLPCATLVLIAGLCGVGVLAIRVLRHAAAASPSVPPQDGTFLLWDTTTHSLRQLRYLTVDALATVPDPPVHGATQCFRWDAPTAQWLPTAAPADAESRPADSGQSPH